MPHRLPLITTTAIATLCEFAALAIFAAFECANSVFLAITESDWLKIFGPNGVAFVSVMATCVLWGTFLRSQSVARKDAIEREAREEKRREKEDAARERRHAELVATNDKNAEELKKLTVESIKAQMIVSAESKTHSNNVQLLSINVHNLCEVLKKSPCLATMKLRDGTDFEMPKDSRL